jgi:sugar diacid utilization regulator
LRAYADADMNVLKAAAALSVHPNTIYSRFEKISDISGLDPSTFHALGELLLLIDCWRE